MTGRGELKVCGIVLMDGMLLSLPSSLAFRLIELGILNNITF